MELDQLDVLKWNPIVFAVAGENLEEGCRQLVGIDQFFERKVEQLERIIGKQTVALEVLKKTFS